MHMMEGVVTLMISLLSSVTVVMLDPKNFRGIVDFTILLKF